MCGERAGSGRKQNLVLLSGGEENILWQVLNWPSEWNATHLFLVLAKTHLRGPIKIWIYFECC